ncbi:MAG: flippase-like domain-containing protein [Flavobacteriaceae bacterium]|nr:flippase-like domain-containing protein [Flavobacteriaceae bacterium]
MYNISYKYKSWLVFIIKLLIVGLAFYFITLKISDNKTLTNTTFINRLQENILNSYSLILVLFLFTLINWFLEIIKWQTLVSTIKQISFFESCKQSLSSLTASLITPNRIGEYGAKAIYYPKLERPRVLILNFLGNFGQMTATICFGVLGFIFFEEKLYGPIKIDSMIRIFLGITSLFFMLFILKKYWVKYWVKFLIHFKSIPKRIHKKNLILSAFRYLVFSHQFYFLLIIFEAEIDYGTAMPIIFSMYFIASIIPGFVIFDWIIKGSIAVSLFDIYGINEIIILSITSLMWLLNFALPSVLGSYFVLTYKSKNLILQENQIV